MKTFFTSLLPLSALLFTLFSCEDSESSDHNGELPDQIIISYNDHYQNGENVNYAPAPSEATWKFNYSEKYLTGIVAKGGYYGWTVTVEYDDLHRVERLTKKSDHQQFDEFSVEFSYEDDLIIAMYDNGDVYELTVDESGRILSYNGDEESYSYKYDSNGNLIEIYSDQVLIRKFEYDAHKGLFSYCLTPQWVIFQFIDLSDLNLCISSNYKQSYLFVPSSDNFRDYNGYDFKYNGNGLPVSGKEWLGEDSFGYSMIIESIKYI